MGLQFPHRKKKEKEEKRASARYVCLVKLWMTRVSAFSSWFPFSAVKWITFFLEFLLSFWVGNIWSSPVHDKQNQWAPSSPAADCSCFWCIREWKKRQLTRRIFSMYAGWGVKPLGWEPRLCAPGKLHKGEEGLRSHKGSRRGPSPSSCSSHLRDSSAGGLELTAVESLTEKVGTQLERSKGHGRGSAADTCRLCPCLCSSLWWGRAPASTCPFLPRAVEFIPNPGVGGDPWKRLLPRQRPEHPSGCGKRGVCATGRCGQKGAAGPGVCRREGLWGRDDAGGGRAGVCGTGRLRGWGDAVEQPWKRGVRAPLTAAAWFPFPTLPALDVAWLGPRRL